MPKNLRCFLVFGFSGKGLAASRIIILFGVAGLALANIVLLCHPSNDLPSERRLNYA